MDWAELNPDLLCLIAKKLGDISNFVRFRVVCKNWRLAVGPRDCPPQLPWFLEWTKVPSDCKFFSLYSKRTHTLHIPQARGSYVYGSSSRYFLMRHYYNSAVSLLNALTRSHFPIPHIENCTISRPIVPNHHPNPNRNENDDIEVIFLNRKKDGFHYLVFCRFANSQWTKIIEVEMPYPKTVLYFQGRLFVLEWESRETKVFDVTTGDEILVIPPSGIRLDWLIEACGDMFGVTEEFTRGQFDVYRLEDDGTSSHWVKMTNGIGDRMLFLERGTGCGLCLKASDFEGFGGNCIYFETVSGHQNGFDLCRHDLESKKTHVLPHSSGFRGPWFVPRLY